MESRVYSHRRGKYQAIGGSTDFALDFERSKLFLVKLVGGALGLDMQATQPYAIARLEVGVG